MKILISARKELNFTVSKFSGGEMHFALQDAPSSPFNADMTCSLRSSDDLMVMLLATDALRRAGCKAIRLCIPYLPYARQDRVCSPGEALSLRVIADIINAQNYFSVGIWDAHSDVALAVIDRAYSVTCTDLLRSFRQLSVFAPEHTVLVAPDAGAIKKVAAAAKEFGTPFVRADKSRDVATMAVTGTVVYSNHVGDRDFLIVDDICDGGRTFIELAKKLRPLTDGKILLYVTHGIFSRGTSVFDGLIDSVLVANSFVDHLPFNFHQLSR